MNRRAMGDVAAVIRREVEDLVSPDPAVRAVALATIRQASHHGYLINDRREACPRITHVDGQLSEHYTTGQD